MKQCEVNHGKFAHENKHVPITKQLQAIHEARKVFHGTVYSTVYIYSSTPLKENTPNMQQPFIILELHYSGAVWYTLQYR